MFDITEFEDTVLTVINQSFFMKVYDGGNSTTGTINFFSIEYYSDYASGVLYAQTASDDPPVNTVNHEDVYVDLILLPNTKVCVVPSMTEVWVGQDFTVSINITDVVNLYGLDIPLGWNSTLLEHINHTVKIPVEDYPDGVLHHPVMKVKDEVNETSGTYWVAYTSVNPAPSFNGSGIVYEIIFHAKNVGNCTLNIFYSKLVDREGNSIPHDTVNGTVYTGECVNIAVTDVLPFKSIVSQ